MKKEMIIAVLCLFTVVACTPNNQVSNETNQQQNESEQTLNEFQIAACNSADENSACNKLTELDIISKEECCNKLNKCCD